MLREEGGGGGGGEGEGEKRQKKEGEPEKWAERQTAALAATTHKDL